jgi:hypothetical protein
VEAGRLVMDTPNKLTSVKAAVHGGEQLTL